MQADRPPVMSFAARCRSPAACAAKSAPKLKSIPGIARSGAASAVNCQKTPLLPPAFVILSGAVQVARTVTDGDGALGHMAEAPLNPLEHARFIARWA